MKIELFFLGEIEHSIRESFNTIYVGDALLSVVIHNYVAVREFGFQRNVLQNK